MNCICLTTDKVESINVFSTAFSHLTQIYLQTCYPTSTTGICRGISHSTSDICGAHRVLVRDIFDFISVFDTLVLISFLSRL